MWSWVRISHKADSDVMGFRFHRRIKLFPGGRLNLSRSGISTSIGSRGAWFTFGKRGTRATVGLPGSGLSYAHVTPRVSADHGQSGATEGLAIPNGKAWRGYLWLALLIAVMSAIIWQRVHG